ncbi:MAG: SUF system Fe-S cluster assembly protein [Rickettsiales bacterium]|jgi:FeS assembly SUF system protein|nr:SUF system Fe-S cluster assembly protein [Rickettsiales bacterium]|tara:strand:+ start:1682 stop:2017 length:336 start_codon:yes stop_codon:yes gene_type:complete
MNKKKNKTDPKNSDFKDEIISLLRTVFDPEIPVNIYDLGLIYDIDLGKNGRVVIKMTLTSPNCPVAESLPVEVEDKVANLPGVMEAKVNLVFDPPWTKEMMSEEARLELNV